jgi:hypothetical protein
MFVETSLTTAPELPATTLARMCYSHMFSGCTSLTKAPKLPATDLADGCYMRMFQDCTSLTKAPELPAATLVNYCYSNMFLGCNSLNEIKCLATYIAALSCTTKWVSGVASTGTFIKHPDTNNWLVDSVDGIPIGWTAIGNGETPTPDPEEPENPDEPETTAYMTFTAEEDGSSVGLNSLSSNQTL